MKTKRTDTDFSKHHLHIKKSDDITIYHLKLPSTFTNSVKFINTNGILAVTGDFGNWIFCREFHPSKEGVSDGYWVQKLEIASSQHPYQFDSDTAKEQISEILKDECETLTHDEIEWLEELYREADEGEYSFIAKAMDKPNSFEWECIPNGKRLNIWLLVIFDAFDEICRRCENGDIGKMLNDIEYEITL